MGADRSGTGVVSFVAILACLGTSLSLVAGCDVLFGLQNPRTDPDAAPDALVAHDEDGDGIDNLLDNCPAVFNPGQQDDGDHDGVGDSCDPHMTTGGDRLVVQDYFDAGNFVWTPDRGSDWARGGGEMTTTSPADATLAALWIARTIKAPTISLGFDVVSYGTGTATNNGLEITIAYPMSSGLCKVIGSSAGDNLDEAVTDVENSANQSTNFSEPVPEGGSVTMTFTREASSTEMGTCLVNNTSTRIIPGPPTTFTDVHASIAVYSMKVSLRYVLLYDVE